jgi:pyrroloquinoline quinone biosynthesis protein B
MKINLIKLLMIIAIAVSASHIVTAAGANPYLYILGVAQDAGYPQTGCYETHCMPGWKNPGLRRGAVSLALVDPSAGKKYMFDATPDFPSQLYDLETEAPSDRFDFAGIFLTHAHIGHYTGLMFLGHEAMGASKVPVYAMPRMLNFLRTNGPWSQLVNFENIILSPLENRKPQLLNSIKVTPFLVPHRDEYSETVGYRIEGPNRSAIFIPDINKWSEWTVNLPELIESVDYALIDAAFYADGELPGRDMSKIPHPFVVETMAALESLSSEERDKVWFIHLNHTNPLLNADSDESELVESKGFNIAVEGIRLML